MCRSWAAGPMFTIDCSRHSLKIEDETHLGVYRSSEWAERCFCKQVRHVAVLPAGRQGPHRGLGGSARRPRRPSLTSQIFIDEKPPYYDFANKTKTMTGAEVFAAFAGSRSGQGLGDERPVRPAQFHDQLRPAASGCARRAAPRARARRRDRRARRPAYRPAASRHREADRAEDLSAGDPVFRPARLRRADEPGARVLPRGRKAARACRCRAARN